MGRNGDVLRFFDGVNFATLQVTPFPSGTAVTSTTSNGSWEVVVANYMFVKVVFTQTSGTVNVAMASSVDNAYQNAFLGVSTVTVASEATSGTNTLTQTAQANRAWLLQELEVSIAGPAWSGGSMLPDGGILGTPGNAMTIRLLGGGSTQSSIINAKFSA